MDTIVKNSANNGRFIPSMYSDWLDGFFTDSLFEDRKAGFLPSTDISEDDKGYYLNLSIPGMNKEEVKIEINEGILSVSGEKKLHKEETVKKYHTVESHYGSFTRSFKLPENSKAEAIEAEYKDGMLNITVPKEEGKVVKSTIQIK
jgi:HSP20 family protein